MGRLQRVVEEKLKTAQTATVLIWGEAELRENNEG